MPAAAAKEASHEVVVSTDSFVLKIPRVRSNNSLSSSCCSPAASYSATSNSVKKLTKAMSDNNLSDCLIPPPSPPQPKHKPTPRGMNPPSFSISLEEETKIDAAAAKNLSSNLSLTDEDCSRGHANALVVDDEGCVGDGNCNIHGNGGNICGSGGHGKGPSDSNSNNNTDAYYQKMIQANPANSLVLSNYAKFLKEVRGDVARAQEYCERAILIDQRDGDALSMYGEIIWEQSKDAQRALTYFDRAIQASPDDCYVMASYARFLWDADEEEEENQVKNDVMESVNRTTPSVAAAS